MLSALPPVKSVICNAEAIFALSFHTGWGTKSTAAYVSVPAKVLQELDLAQRALGQDLLAENIGDFLDRDAFVRLVVDGSADMIHNRYQLLMPNLRGAPCTSGR